MKIDQLIDKTDNTGVM